MKNCPSTVHHGEVRQDIAVDHRALAETGAAGDLWTARDGRRRDAIDVDHLITVTADVARRMDGTDRAGTIDLPLATDRVGRIVPETDEIIRIVDLDRRIIDRDPRIKDHRWIVRETGNGLPIVRRMPRIRRETRKRTRKLKDRLIQDREKSCEMADLNRVARKVARVVPLAMRTSHLGK